MNIAESLIEILKYTAPAIVVLIATYSIMGKFVNGEIRKKQLDLIHDTQNETIRLRLHAYERLILFVERIHPRQLAPRLYHPEMTVLDLQQAVVSAIRTEYEHNLSQQIYVTRQVWDTVRNVKEQETNMINQIAQQLPKDGPARDLHKRIVDYVITVEGELPTDIALQLISDEAKKIMQYGPIA